MLTSPQALANEIRTPEELGTLAEGPNKRKDIKAPTVPIISVPTSLSAGEYSNFAGGTEDSSKRKYSFQPPIRGPELVILDPELAQTTPDSIWLSTGVRAVDHCIETLCAVVGTTTSSDELAQRALSLLVPGLLRCKKDHADRAAYLQCQLGSVEAMAACTSGSIELGASHGIGHQVCYLSLTSLDLYDNGSIEFSSAHLASVMARLAVFFCRPCANTMPSTMRTGINRTKCASS